MENVIPPSNVLAVIHALLIKLPIDVRDAICKECNYSVPTYYRKVRAVDKKSRSNKNVPALSNAEKGMIIKVVFDILLATIQYLDNYRKKDE